MHSAEPDGQFSVTNGDAVHLLDHVRASLGAGEADITGATRDIEIDAGRHGDAGLDEQSARKIILSFVNLRTLA